MTVKELREKLKEMPQDSEVMVESFLNGDYARDIHEVSNSFLIDENDILYHEEDDFDYVSEDKNETIKIVLLTQ